MGIGRISHPPRLIAEGLLYGTLEAPFVYRLLGVRQHLPTMANVGFFFSIAAVLGIHPAGLAQELAETVMFIKETYMSRRTGAIVFASAEALSSAILDTFAPRTSGAPEQFSPFGPGGDAHGGWKAIIADLVIIRYEVYIVEFVVAGQITMDARTAVANRLRCSDRTTIDVAIMVASEEAGTYPLVAMDEREFLHHSYNRGPAAGSSPPSTGTTRSTTGSSRSRGTVGSSPAESLEGASRGGKTTGEETRLANPLPVREPATCATG